MNLIKIRQGLDLPIAGKPDQGEIRDLTETSRTALLGSDFTGISPKIVVKQGEKVKKGQVLFFDRKKPSVKFTSFGSGTVTEINRGQKRKLVSVVVELDSGNDEIKFPFYKREKLGELNASEIKDILTQSGLWTAIRQRPFGKIADPEIFPHSIFIYATDTNPLAPDTDITIKGREEEFLAGIEILSRLTNGTLFLCKKQNSIVPEPDYKRVQVHFFSGPHPAGNPGTHIYFLDPVTKSKKVWYINAQSTADIGRLFLTGSLPEFKIISIAGPEVKNPGIFRVRKGSHISGLLKDNLSGNKLRIISGSVFNGHTAEKEAGYLGMFHNQITVISDDVKRPFLGWLRPGFDVYSVLNVTASKILPNKKFRFNTALNGGIRAVFPVKSFEKVNVFRTEPVYLLRALAVGDIDDSINLGCLHFTEEDIALLSFVCPAKIDHGKNLRNVLTEIEKEGL
ncbi:Na(+)-translocating NADH-quinone reductase subunit A [bacterium]|nr:Na(+)-translocating NADH-quinone reductase subunit A [bacterium]